MSNVSKRDLGIRRFRERYGLTQGALAKKLGVSRWTLTRWESWEAGLSPPRGRKPPVRLVQLALLRVAQGRHPKSDAENLRRRTEYRERQLARERGSAGYWG